VVVLIHTFSSNFLNLTAKKNYENWSTFAAIIVKIKVGYLFETRDISLYALNFRGADYM